MKPFQAKWIKASGEVTHVNPANGTDFKLKELKQFVGGGYIEVIYPPGRSSAIMVINEEGKLDGLPINLLATRMWLEYCQPGSPREDDPVVGDVLLCHTDQVL